EVSEESFSTWRAFEHVEAMAREPHYVGSRAHSSVRNYIVSSLQKSGLLVQTQQGSFLNKFGVITAPENILTRIEGSGDGKALLLMSHYDSAVHSSPGASDAASGVATILEGIRAFIASGEVPINDVIILFTDAEELGLNGAALFVEEHPWAEEVGLALNFEARGSGGPSFMLLETNGGNKKLIEHFVEANPEFPVTNSLAYSIYKMLPNDTDLTVLREKGNIPGFNFAFIDDHFDYHTANDTPENLDINTLAHQGSYLMPLLEYFANVPLEDLQPEVDLIYFVLPVIGMVSYPFSWILPMLFFSLFIFAGLILYGLKKERLELRSILIGFFPLFLSLLSAGIITYFLWEICLLVYPQYLEMEHGFTYNGYYYIAAAILFSLSLLFFIYSRFHTKENCGNFYIAALFVWLLLSAAVSFYLKGAAYFVVPLFFGLLQLLYLLIRKTPNPVIPALLNLPAIFIIQPLLISFPVALGLEILFVTSVLTVLLSVLLLPVIGFFRKKGIISLFFFFVFLCSVALAHLNSEFSLEHPRPNSLVYIYDSDSGSATWNTYDEFTDSWTAPYFSGESMEKMEPTTFSSKYNSRFTRIARAPAIDIEPPVILIEKDRDTVGKTQVEMKIAFSRKIARVDLFAEGDFDPGYFEVNGEVAGYLNEANKDKEANRLLTYYAANQDTLRLKFSFSSGTMPQLNYYGTSYDLLKNDRLNVPARPPGMMPRPFVINDAVILKKTIDI
ncbi:MAG TPA: M28 family peptidase, partial [Salinimicrobium sp.]|nr:M28 family peptidase [Salinimicrobium sp.]